jgi:16S rRNA (cytosine967-C5)-methyltransferase
VKLKTKITARTLALRLLDKVLHHGQSLSALKSQTHELDARERALCLELVQGVLRWRWRLEFYLQSYLQKPLRNKDRDVHLLLLLALYEVTQMHTPDYASVNEAVQLTRALGKSWASALVNGVLRQCIRDLQADALPEPDTESARYAHPDWLLARIHADWPQHWQEILEANNTRALLWLRVNASQNSTANYQQQLSECGLASQTHPYATEALSLDQACDVTALPGFAEGAVSVQDASAQIAAHLLAARAGERILDLCAAPGGKTCHLLELQPDLDVVAVDIEAERMQRVQQNLQRTRTRAECIVADAREVESWWNGIVFDRILLDAPCSASGVIRRHPDIKSLRRDDDIAALVELQQQILRAAWSTLKPGGELLYVTCSLLRVENEQQIENFLSSHPEAQELAIASSLGMACGHGRQCLPGEMGGDGFYFARLRKPG